MYEINPIKKAAINANYLMMKQRAREFHKKVTRKNVPEFVVMEVKKNLILNTIEGEVWRK